MFRTSPLPTLSFSRSSLPTTLHYTTLHYYTTPHDTTLPTLHYTTLHYTTLHYTTLHYTTLHYTALHCTTLHYTTLHASNFFPSATTFLHVRNWQHRTMGAGGGAYLKLDMKKGPKHSGSPVKVFWQTSPFVITLRFVFCRDSSLHLFSGLGITLLYVVHGNI